MVALILVELSFDLFQTTHKVSVFTVSPDFIVSNKKPEFTLKLNNPTNINFNIIRDLLNKVFCLIFFRNDTSGERFMLAYHFNENRQFIGFYLTNSRLANISVIQRLELRWVSINHRALNYQFLYDIRISKYHCLGTYLTIQNLLFIQNLKAQACLFDVI
jgi:hypothetical protein